MNSEPEYRGGPGQRAAREQLRLEAQRSDLRRGSKAEREVSRIPRVRAVAAERSVPIAPHVEAPAGREPRRVPLTWVKNAVGVFLLPVAWVWTLSFIGVFRRVTVHRAFWRTEDFWFFLLGALLWGLTFCGSLYARGEPWLLRWYVWVHEYTHAIWTWLSNGRVSELKVYRDHGHILTNKPTVLVTLAPYFYPLPCVVLLTLFLLVRPFCAIEEAPPVLWGWLLPMQIFLILMGVGWSFHCTFTVWMIRRGQSDLKMHGNLFSLVLIYIVNLAVVSLFLIITAPGVEVGTFGRELFFNAKDFSDFVWALGTRLSRL